MSNKGCSIERSIGSSIGNSIRIRAVSTYRE